MRISNLLHPDVVLPDVDTERKDELLFHVANRLSRCYPAIDRDRLAAALFKRERMMGTAVADGVAIPHARLRGIAEPIVAFGRSRAGIDWDAPDGKPIHLFLVLVVPEDAAGSHLKLLAAASRILQDERCRSALMAATDATSLLDALKQAEARLDPTARLVAVR